MEQSDTGDFILVHPNSNSGDPSDELAAISAPQGKAGEIAPTASDTAPAAVQNMSVDHSCLDVAVPEQFLDWAAGGYQRNAECMHAGGLREICPRLQRVAYAMERRRRSESLARLKLFVIRFRDEETRSAVTPERFEFSVPAHVTYLAGYMNAVGRVLTTDAELWTLTARDAGAAVDGDLVPGITVRTRSFVENWSQQFGWLVENFLGMDQRSRLGFYLIDYICWFDEFTRNAECFKLDCEFLTARTIDQAVYLLQLEGDRRVLLLAQRLDKTHNEPSQPIAREDARPG